MQTYYVTFLCGVCMGLNCLGAVFNIEMGDYRLRYMYTCFYCNIFI